MERWLLKNGVFVLSAGKRKPLAEQLERMGLTTAQLDVLATYIRRSAKTQALGCAYLCGILRDSDRLLGVLADLATYRGPTALAKPAECSGICEGWREVRQPLGWRPGRPRLVM